MVCEGTPVARDGLRQSTARHRVLVWGAHVRACCCSGAARAARRIVRDADAPAPRGVVALDVGASDGTCPGASVIQGRRPVARGKRTACFARSFGIRRRRWDRGQPASATPPCGSLTASKGVLLQAVVETDVFRAATSTKTETSAPFMSAPAPAAPACCNRRPPHGSTCSATRCPRRQRRPSRRRRQRQRPHLQR